MTAASPAASPDTSPAASPETAVDRAAARLAQAAATGVPCAPVRDLIDAGDVATAYRVQERGTAARVAAGARRTGRKIGLTSPAVQAQLGVDSPDFGTLFDDMAVVPGTPVPAGALLQPRIEAEIAFVLGTDLTSDDPDAVAAAVATAHPALEIVDSRIVGWDITLADTVADNASSGLFVVGAGVPLAAVDTAAVAMELDRDGRVVSTGTGAACLGGPLLALAWLARTAAGLGDPLRAGEVVLSGALGPMVPVSPGETYTARITGLGPVTAVFAGVAP